MPATRNRRHGYLSVFFSRTVLTILRNTWRRIALVYKTKSHHADTICVFMADQSTSSTRNVFICTKMCSKKKKKMLQNTYAPIFEYAFKMCYVQLRKNEFLDLFTEKMMYSKLINYSPCCH